MVKNKNKRKKVVIFDGNINGKVYGGRYTLKECNKKGIVFSWVGLSFNYKALNMFHL